MDHAALPFEEVKSVRVVLSSRGLAFDLAALRNLITQAYTGAVVFFVSTSGDPLGAAGPDQVDLIIDFTEPTARQSMFFAMKMRSRGRHVVGRKKGWYRAARYDRVYDQGADASIPSDYLESEHWAQKRVLELAGVPVVRHGGVTPDLSKEIGSLRS